MAYLMRSHDFNCNVKDVRTFHSFNHQDCTLYFQVFLGQSGGLDSDGNELPRLVYVSREKRPGFQHHKKAGAMNALVSHIYRSLQ